MSAPQERVFVRTERVDHPVDLRERLSSQVSAAWLHEGRGLLARGEALRIETSGPGRFAEASARWRAVAEAAGVEDAARVRGSGLVALGSFSYAASSARPSLLVVPEMLLGVTRDAAFLTVARVGEPPPSPSSDAWRELFPVAVRTPPPGDCELDIEPDHTPDEYQGLVAECVARIRRGEAEKIVLSETTTVRVARPVDPAGLLGRLAERYPSTWVYRAGDVIGASPEMLAQTRDGRVRSRVLAGSRPVADGGGLSDEERRTFLADAKERSEHAFAVDSVTGRLAEVAADVTASPEPFVLRLPGIEHLASEVTGALREGATSLDVAGRLHPSAAVSGTPRERAEAAIADLEAHDRGGYASPVGWIDAQGDGEWAIALRMAHLLGEHEVRLQAGGGLVAASDPVIEHAEVLAKMRPVLHALRGE